MKAWAWVPAILIALFVVACAPQRETAAQASFTQSTFAWTNSSGARFPLDGTNNQNLSGGVFTDYRDVSQSTEFALWANCVGNVTTMKYQVSPDATLWMNGSVAFPSCNGNLTKVEPTEKAFRYIRGYVQTGLNSAAGNKTNVTFLLTAK